MLASMGKSTRRGRREQTSKYMGFFVLFPILYINPSWPDTHTPFFLLKIAFAGGRAVQVEKVHGEDFWTFDQNRPVYVDFQNIHNTEDP